MRSFIRLLGTPTTLFLLLYPILDLLVRIYPPLGLVGYGWIASVYLIVFGVAGRSFWGLVAQAREGRRWWTVGSIVLWWLFIVGVAIPERLLSNENIFQFGCAQGAFRHAQDLGFLGQCFIGYPTRSYLLQVLPVHFFGFSPFLANLGASLLLFPGIVLLAQAIRIVTARARLSDFITGLAMLSLFQCALLIRIIYYHDQTTHPVALTMIFVGLVALWIERSDRLAFFSLLALILISTSMYPPILSILCLLGVFLLSMFMRNELPQGSGGTLVITGILAVVCFAQTLAYRLDLRLNVGKDHFEHFPDRVQALVTFILTQRNGMWYAALPFQSIFLLFLLGGVLVRFGWPVFFFSAWSVALIFVSFFVSGASPELAFWKMSGMHRTAPIFPLFVLLVAFGLSRRIEAYSLSMRLRALMVLCVVVPGTWVVYRLPIPNLSPLSLRVWQAAQKVIPIGVKPKPTLITRNDIPALGELPKDYLYLNPERTFEHYAGSCLPQKLVPPNTLVVTMDDAACQQTPSRPGFEELAAWGELVLGKWQYTANTIRVYRALPPTK